MDKVTPASAPLCWETCGGRLRLEFSPELFGQVLFAAEDGLRQLSRGGIENGGVLFGRRQRDVIQVLAFRPIPCEHTRGPAFLLSNNDRNQLMNLLELADEDRGLKGMEPVGWFVSHTRQGLMLSDEDRDLFRQFFPEALNFALVLHPARLSPTWAALFVRDKDGVIWEDLDQREFHLRDFPLTQSPPTDSQKPSNEVKTNPAGSDHAWGIVKSSVGGGVPARLPSGTFSTWRKIPGWAYASLGVLLCGALVLAIPMRRPDRPGSGSEAIQLRLQDSKGQLRVEWDKESSTVADAEGAILYITDGKALAPIELDKDTAQKGFLTYGRLSEDVTVRMVVRRKERQPYQEISRFVGAPIPKEVPKELQEARQRRETLLSEIRKLREQIRRELERSQSLETTVGKLERQLEKEVRDSR